MGLGRVSFPMGCQPDSPYQPIRLLQSEGHVIVRGPVLGLGGQALAVQSTLTDWKNQHPELVP